MQESEATSLKTVVCLDLDVIRLLLWLWVLVEGRDEWPVNVHHFTFRITVPRWQAWKLKSRVDGSFFMVSQLSSGPKVYVY